jgi:hypothetical protein
MNDRKPTSDADIEQASAVWLARRAAGDAPPEWVQDLQLDWVRLGDYEATWRFVLRLCKGAADDDRDTVEMIGADPLHDLIVNWPDAALTSIEAEVDANPTLLQALATIMTETQPIRRRIDAILARHDQEQL